MNGLMAGAFSEKDRNKFQKFQMNLKNFQTVVKDLIKTHSQQRFYSTSLPAKYFKNYFKHVNFQR